MTSRRRVNSKRYVASMEGTMRTLLSVLLSLILSMIVYAQGQDQKSSLSMPMAPPQVFEVTQRDLIVVRAVIPGYPAIAASKRISGAVLIDVDVNEKGNVIEARPIVGDKLLRNSAKKAALAWQFNADERGNLRSVRLTFIFHDVSYVAPGKRPQFTCPYQVEIERTGVV